MIIDTYTVTGVTFAEYPLGKYLRFTEYTWYMTGADHSLVLLSFETASRVEELYQRRLKKS